ncbi:MAG: hypothetical protein IJI35_02145 [Kiritimatiellae bacterium]|nr:hypothetical protein [Kiritimatiellia bacterium]
MRSRLRWGEASRRTAAIADEPAMRFCLVYRLHFVSPLNLFRQLTQFGAEAVGLGFVVVLDGILKRCAVEATLRRGDSPTANPKGAQASAQV